MVVLIKIVIKFHRNKKLTVIGNKATHPIKTEPATKADIIHPILDGFRKTNTVFSTFRKKKS